MESGWKTLMWTYKSTCCFVECAKPFSLDKGLWIQSLCEQISEVNVWNEVVGRNGG